MLTATAREPMPLSEGLAEFLDRMPAHLRESIRWVDMTTLEVRRGGFVAGAYALTEDEARALRDSLSRSLGEAS